MRRFKCGRCATEVPFEADRCPHCDALLGYVPHLRDICVLQETAQPSRYAISSDATLWWRCLNHAWHCNWMLPSDAGDVWCRSCRLTRGRPDTASPDAVAAWSTAELDKRRLVDQLLALGLPLDAPSDPRLVFDLLFLPDGAGVTGHRQGVVTLDLRETDDAYREALRRQLGESYRTVIGHLRHEIGHHYWPTLVGTTPQVDEFRALFGDERADYAGALERHYESPAPGMPDDHVSTYARVHPSEDWAETFAHYLHIRDGLETATEHGLLGAVDSDAIDAIDAMLRAWGPLADALNALSRGLGHQPAYPFHHGPAVAEKLAFVHRTVRQLTR